MDKKVIVVSGINLRSGGPLTILRDCLQFISQSGLAKQYRIIALVHRKDLAEFPDIEYVEFPKSIDNWFRRLYYEYIYFNRFSKKVNPYLWLSLHDITPRVIAKYQVVYMHNPSIVNKIKFKDIFFDKTYILFSLFYRYLYRLNIHKNRFCIVQQFWLKDCISRMFEIPREKIIVARPYLSDEKNGCSDVPTEIKRNQCQKFFFPSFPRPFKNFEVICEATKLLYEEGYRNIEVKLTIDGSESSYSRKIVKKYKAIPTIHFCGLLPKEEVQTSYQETDCLIFPSRLETWGLPISEFKPFNKPIIVADEPYSHESVEGCQCVAFFSTHSPSSLAKLMEDLIKGNYSRFAKVPAKEIENPFASSYKEMFQLLLR